MKQHQVAKKISIALFLFLSLIVVMTTQAIIPFGFFRKKGPINCAIGSPSVGALCTGGTYFLGTLSPGATSGSGTDSYLTTPGGCGDIPVGSVSGGTGFSSYTLTDFTPTCTGADSLTKYWNDGSENWYHIPGLTNYLATRGTGQGASNTDQYYGDANTANIVAITNPAQGGYHAAARYCDKLSYGGYTDWYLPNRYELNLMNTNAALIPGLDISANWYLSSTEYAYDGYWSQRFNDGYQATSDRKNYNTHKVRCVRRIDPCVEGVPTPGTICKGGTVFLGTLSPGATSGSGTDRYMTTPGGCQFPSGSISGGSSYSSYALSDFTPICLGTDSLQLNWNDGTTNWFDNPSLPNSTIESEMDIYYGNTNTANIASITTGANGGYHAAARFCDKLSFGGYTDWYLPNKNELILMWTNQANIPGLNRTGAYYWASTEYNNIYAWVQRFTDGGLGWNPKNYWASLVRCVRRF